MLKIRRPLGRLIFNMGIAIPGKTVFLIETAPWSYWGRRWISFHVSQRSPQLGYDVCVTCQAWTWFLRSNIYYAPGLVDPSYSFLNDFFSLSIGRLIEAAPHFLDQIFHFLRNAIGWCWSYIFISAPMACVEHGTDDNLHMYCYVGLFRGIQTIHATLVRLPNTDSCKDANGVNDGECVCETESRMIAQELRERCIWESDCDYTLQYPNSSDCLEPVSSPLLLKIEYKCGTGT